MTSQLRDPIYLTPGGAKTALLVGLSLTGDDTVASMDDVTITASSADLVVTNAAITGGSATINGRAYAAGQVIGYDLAYAGPTLPGGAIAGYVDFTWSSVGGNGGSDRVLVEVTPFVFGDYNSTPASYYGPSYDAVLGTASGAENLGSFTNRNATYPTIAANESVKGALQDLLTTHEQDWIFNVLDYGANNNATGDGTRDSYAAIQAALTDIRAAIRSQVSGTGSSINRQYVPVLYFPPGGKYEISAPIDLYQYSINIRGYNAQLMATSTFNTNHPDGWAFRSGDYSSGYVHMNTGNVYVDIAGLSFHGFKRCLRLGLPGNNINQGAMVIRDCHFMGVSSSVYCDVAIRIANRSTVATITNCHWDKCDVCVDVQSADRVRVQDSRCQAVNFPPYATRDLRHGYFRVYRGQLHCDRLLCNPENTSLISQMDTWANSTAYEIGDYVRATTPTVNKQQIYKCIEDHESIADPGVFATDLSASKWELTDQKPVGWTLASDVPRFTASKYYVRGDIIREPYTSGANEVLWARKTAGTSGATFDATEQQQWYVWAASLHGPGSWVGGKSYQEGDIVRALVEGGTYPTGYRFWRSNSTRVATGTWDNAERENWTIVTNSDGNNYAGDDASVWRCIYINQSFFGGEGGGIIPVIWDTSHDDEDDYAAYVGYATDCQIKQSTIGNNVLHASKNEGIANGLFAPAVLLVQAPNRLIVDDNLFSLTFGVAAQWSADSTYTPWAIGVDAPRYVRAQGNIGSSARLLSGYTENYVPPDLLTETVTAASPALKVDGVTRLDSSGNAITATLGNGNQIGDTKIVVMTDASNSSTLSVTQHETSDPEVFTFNAVGEYLELRWDGSQWVTIKATATV